MKIGSSTHIYIPRIPVGMPGKVVPENEIRVTIVCKTETIYHYQVVTDKLNWSIISNNLNYFHIMSHV